MSTPRFSSPGYTKQRGAGSERNEMTVEAQSHLGDWTEAGAPTDDPKKSGILVSIGVALKPNERPLDDRAENAIKLTLDQARSFAESILKEVSEAETCLKEIGNF